VQESGRPLSFPRRFPEPDLLKLRKPSDKVVYVAELLNWRVQKLMLH
jgi:hypothetical protein